MPIIDLRAFCQAHKIEHAFDALKESRVWYEQRYGHPSTLPHQLLFNARLLESSTQQLCALLLILEMTEDERALFWTAKTYFCLPLAAGWTACRDSRDAELFKFEDKRCPFHPSISYVISLIGHHMNQLIANPQQPHPEINKNEFHYVRAGACKTTNHLLENELVWSEQQSSIGKENRIVSERIFETFANLKEKLGNSNGLQRRLLLLSLLSRRVSGKTGNLFGYKRPVLLQVNNRPRLDPATLVQKQRFCNNFMAQQTPQVKLGAFEIMRAKVLKSKPENNENSIPIKTIELEAALPNSKSPRAAAAASRLARLNMFSSKKARLMQKRDSMDKYEALTSYAQPYAARFCQRPKSDFTIRDRSGLAAQKQFYADLVTRTKPTQIRLSSVANALSPQPFYNVARESQEMRVYQPGSTLLSFKFKGK